jgi:hypothetical protein
LRDKPVLRGVVHAEQHAIVLQRTAGVGICVAGTETCNAQGNGYGPCMGEIVPVAEDCNTPEDDDCDGMVNEGCMSVGCLGGSPNGVCEAFEPCTCFDCSADASCQATCVADSMCTLDDDCVCDDCDTDAFCSDPTNCVTDGICDPYNEGCVCADCATNPACVP